MKVMTARDTIKTHYIDGAFVESHGQEIMDILRPTDGKVIARVTLGDEEDTRRAIGAARRAFATFGRTTKEERASILRRLHQAISARIDDLTAAWWRSMEVLCSSLGLSWNPESMPFRLLRRDSKNCL
jgi:NAD-dependent aldehyde dehydrogenases